MQLLLAFSGLALLLQTAFAFVRPYLLALPTSHGPDLGPRRQTHLSSRIPSSLWFQREDPLGQKDEETAVNDDLGVLGSTVRRKLNAASKAMRRLYRRRRGRYLLVESDAGWPFDEDTVLLAEDEQRVLRLLRRLYRILYRTRSREPGALAIYESGRFGVNAASTVAAERVSSSLPRLRVAPKLRTLEPPLTQEPPPPKDTAPAVIVDTIEPVDEVKVNQTPPAASRGGMLSVEEAKERVRQMLSEMKGKADNQTNAEPKAFAGVKQPSSGRRSPYSANRIQREEDAATSLARSEASTAAMTRLDETAEAINAAIERLGVRLPSAKLKPNSTLSSGDLNSNATATAVEFSSPLPETKDVLKPEDASDADKGPPEAPLEGSTPLIQEKIRAQGGGSIPADFESKSSEMPAFSDTMQGGSVQNDYSDQPVVNLSTVSNLSFPIIEPSDDTAMESIDLKTEGVNISANESFNSSLPLCSVGDEGSLAVLEDSRDKDEESDLRKTVSERDARSMGEPSQVNPLEFFEKLFGFQKKTNVSVNDTAAADHVFSDDTEILPTEPQISGDITDAPVEESRADMTPPLSSETGEEKSFPMALENYSVTTNATAISQGPLPDILQSFFKRVFGIPKQSTQQELNAAIDGKDSEEETMASERTEEHKLTNEAAALAEAMRLEAEAAVKAKEGRKAAEAAAAREEMLRLEAEAALKAEEERKAAEEAAAREEMLRLEAEAALKAEEERKAAEEAAAREEMLRLEAEAALKAEEERKGAEEAAAREEMLRLEAEAALKAEEERKAAESAAAFAGVVRSEVKALAKLEEDFSKFVADDEVMPLQFETAETLMGVLSTVDPSLASSGFDETFNRSDMADKEFGGSYPDISESSRIMRIFGNPFRKLLKFVRSNKRQIPWKPTFPTGPSVARNASSFDKTLSKLIDSLESEVQHKDGDATTHSRPEETVAASSGTSMHSDTIFYFIHPIFKMS